MTHYKQRQATVFNREELKAIAIERHKAGDRYSVIAKAIGVDPDTVHSWVDPDYGKKRSEAANARKRAKYAEAQFKKKGGLQRYAGRAETRPDPVRDGAILPPRYDMRDLTARMLGDPMPGRSALDRRGWQ